MAELTIKVPDALAAEGDVAREVLRVLGVGRTVSMPAGFELARSSGGLVGASAH